MFHSFSETWHEEVRARHRESKFLAIVKDGTLAKAYASLPRLLHGSNGNLIKTPEELDRARDGFLALVRHSNHTARMDDLKIDRLDLVLNPPLDPRLVLALHRYAKHPMINLETEQYHNTPPKKRWGKPPHRLSELNTVRLHGTRTTIQLYDKVRELLGKTSEKWPEDSRCTRIEIQLRGAAHIAKQLGFEGRDYITLDQLDFGACYFAYRKILMGFDDNGAVPKFEPSLVSFLAILERHPVTWEALGGMSPIDWWRHSKIPKPKRFREVRKEVGNMQLELEQFRWADQLPVDRLPDIIDVDENGQVQLIASHWSFRCLTDPIPGPPTP
ncbi:MAG: hypothetical protein P1U86_22825 [Verrucomicrobiales bacterium]|nr:hypothetical protein [Verrucomicrobiales bacterium]